MQDSFNDAIDTKLQETFNPTQENELIADFQKQPTPEKFEELYNTFEGPLESAMNTYGALNTNLPREAIKANALVQFDKALKTYSPGTAKFTTWLYNKMRPIQRYIRDNSDIAHIPDNRAMHIARLRERTMFLQDKLDREPSTSELAEDLKWPEKRVGLLQKELKKDLLAEEGLETIAETHEVEVIEDRARALKMDLEGKQQLILEYLLGLDGKPKLKVKQIADKMGLPENKVRQEQRKIQNQWVSYYGSKDL